MKKLSDITWNVTEEEYRADPALSYSTLSRFDREGFANIDKLFDKQEAPSLLLGQLVDTIITDGEEEFNNRFVVAEYPDIPDSIIQIVKALFNKFSDTYRILESIPNEVYRYKKKLVLLKLLKDNTYRFFEIKTITQLRQWIKDYKDKKYEETK